MPNNGVCGVTTVAFGGVHVGATVWAAAETDPPLPTFQAGNGGAVFSLLPLENSDGKIAPITRPMPTPNTIFIEIACPIIRPSNRLSRGFGAIRR